MLIIVSNVATDLLECALTGMILGDVTDNGVNVSVDANVNVFAGVMTAFEFAMAGPLEKLRC